MAIGAGDLRSWAVFFERAVADDGAGNWRENWLPKLTRRCKLVANRGSEGLDATRSEARGLVTVYIRSDPETRTITTDWKMQDGTNEYNIRSVADPFMGSPQHGQWVMLTAEFGRAHG